MADQLRLVLSTRTFLPMVGGAELGLHEIACRLGSRHRVTVLASGGEEGDSDYRPDGYRVVRVTRSRGAAKSLRGRVSEYTGWAYARTLLQTHRADGPVDALNCHFMRRSLLVALAARYLLRIPVILSLVGRGDVVADLGRAGRARAALMLHLADAVIANSTYYLRGSSFAGTATVIPYGVDLQRFLPRQERGGARRRLDLDEADFVILAVQRLEPLKRVDLLLRVLAELLPELPEAKLVVVGTGGQERDLRALADQLDVAPAVRFAGYVPELELPSMYSLADVFATHSESETFGITFTEAMAAGLPIVAADTSCVRDVLTAEVATIVAPGEVNAYARALLELALDREKRDLRGRTGRRRAEKQYDWEATANAYERVIRSCLPAGSGATG